MKCFPGPVRMLQRREADPQKSDFVARPDDVPGVDPQGDLVDGLQVLVELGQQPGGGVLLEPEELTARTQTEERLFMFFFI